MINTWFKFEGKIQNDSKVITSKEIHTATDDDDDSDDDGTKNKMSPSIPGRRYKFSGCA